MNAYQRVAVLVFRITATLGIGIGLMGLGYSASVDDRPRLISALVWSLASAVLAVASLPLGRLVGRGLD